MRSRQAETKPVPAELTRSDRLVFRVSWIALLVVSLAILLFGLIVLVLPMADEGYIRSIGVASIGMGLFGAMITVTAFRRRERWAYVTLWYLPIFWLAHLVGNLPPGQDHIHQVVFIVLSVLGLVAPLREFFPSRRN
jgi:hypothetical protein